MQDVAIGKLGVAMAIVFPLMDFLGPALQLAGAVGGLVLLWYSIKHKRMQIKHMKNGGKNES